MNENVHYTSPRFFLQVLINLTDDVVNGFIRSEVDDSISHTVLSVSTISLFNIRILHYFSGVKCGFRRRNLPIRVQYLKQWIRLTDCTKDKQQHSVRTSVLLSNNRNANRIERFSNEAVKGNRRMGHGSRWEL